MHCSFSACTSKTPGRFGQTLAAFLVALMPALFCSGSASAVEQDCMSSYYRTKSQACLDKVLAQFRQTAPRGATDTMIGFLAQLFMDSPGERARILASEPSEGVRQIAVFSLYEAGLTDEAQKFAAANNLAALSDKLRMNPIKHLDEIKPSSRPGDNDQLIAAYMASGDRNLIRRVLDNFSSANDEMAGDAFRIGFMTSKFGPTLVPKYRDIVPLQVACAKYQCSQDKTNLMRVMTMSSAIWALQSMSASDEGVNKTLSDFFASEPRLKNLFAIEQQAFGNYQVTLGLLAALKVNRTPDQEPGYAAANRYAGIYESFGPAKDVLAPLPVVKK